MASTRVLSALALLFAAACMSGCAASLPGEEPPGGAVAAETYLDAGSEVQTIVSGAADSTGPLPGSATALYRYRFVQIMPGSDRFTFRDRDLSFHFRPAPDALYFQVENFKDRPVWIEWDRCVFYDPRGRRGETAHGSTRWADRFDTQPPTQIPGLQRYSDYVLPLSYLVDPAGSDQQLHRPLLPEDSTAPQYSDKEFGVDLVFRVEDRPRTYAFRFKVASVIPR